MTQHIIFPGPGKCGTSFLFDLVSTYFKDSRVNLPKIKESNYLLRSPDRYNYHQYLSSYSKPDHSLPFFDFSNTYFFSTNFSSNLSQLCNFTLYISLRDPVERVYSHLYQYALTHNYRSLDEALDNHLDVLTRSLYTKQLFKFKPYSSKINFITLDDIKNNPQSILSMLSSHIGVYPSKDFDSSLQLKTNMRKSSRLPLATYISKSAYRLVKYLSPLLASKLKYSPTLNGLLYEDSLKRMPSSENLHLYIENYFTEEYLSLKTNYGISF